MGEFMRSISILFLFLFLISITSNASSIRSTCENAYYATGYVKLHQYTVNVLWEKVSDNNLVKLENMLFDRFDIIKISHYQNSSKYLIKEKTNYNSNFYENLLTQLRSIPVNVSCTYDI